MDVWSLLKEVYLAHTICINMNKSLNKLFVNKKYPEEEGKKAKPHTKCLKMYGLSSSANISVTPMNKNFNIDRALFSLM